MNKQNTIDKLAQVFFDFAESLGFDQRSIKADAMYTILYGVGNHGLKVEIDWRDFYLNVFVFRTVNGKIPQYNFDSHSKRAYSVSICDIYNTEYPNQSAPNERSEETLLYTLNAIIAMVRKEPEVLSTFLDNIDENTSPEKTREYYRRNILRRIEMLKMRYAQGKLSEQAYTILHDDLIKTLSKW